jgi:hypothetical protein
VERTARPFVPVVVHKVGYADAKDGGFEAGVETGKAFALDDALRCIEKAGVCAARLDLRAGGKGEERVGEEGGEDAAAWEVVSVIPRWKRRDRIRAVRLSILKWIEERREENIPAPAIA